MLARLGVGTLPAPLAAALERFDLRFALSQFARDLGVRPKPLFDARHRAHAAVRERFCAAFVLRQQIEHEAGQSPLDAAPLFAALNGPLRRVQRLLTLYRRATKLHAVATSADSRLPQIQALRASVLGRLEKWHRLSEWRVEKDAAAMERVSTLARQLDDLVEEIDAQMDARQLGPNSRHGATPVALAASLDARVVLEEAKTGRLRLDIAVDRLADALATFREPSGQRCSRNPSDGRDSGLHRRMPWPHA